MRLLKKISVATLFAVLAALILWAYIAYFRPYQGEPFDVQYSDKYFELRQKESLTEDEVRYLDQEDERVRKDSIEAYKKWKEDRKYFK